MPMLVFQVNDYSPLAIMVMLAVYSDVMHEAIYYSRVATISFAELQAWLLLNLMAATA